ncbi:lysine--tRNA ligase [Candidatus Babeliales bacterium]|nr:lysine--tRNA ligase [Candidatus Babeliales bacterium]
MSENKNNPQGLVNSQERSPSEEHEFRVKKVDALRKKGINPWPYAKNVPNVVQQVIDDFVEDSDKEYSVAGRLMALRGHGKTVFAKIQDRSGSLQLYFKQDILGDEQFALFVDYIDLGDIVWVRGIPFKTKTGEVTLRVSEFTLLSKCLHPLPEKFHGIADVEIKYRQRHLDLISSPESRQKFKIRSKLISRLRNFLEENDFMEVETPMLHPIPGGAVARPFVTHHNTYDMDLYLRIAPELYLKRLVVGGFERVYEINRNFRNEGVSTRHNPEFTMLEFYIAHKDYHFAIDFTQNMIRTVIKEACGALQVQFGVHELNFEKPFDVMSIKDAVLKHGNYTEAAIAPDKIDAELKKHGAKKIPKDAGWGQKLFLLFEEVAEAKLIQPTFIIDFPVEVSPLARRDENNPEFVARFELFMAGMELANSFNELNEPFDQKERFEAQAKTHAAGDDEAMHFDGDYVHTIEYGLPPTVGVGIGIDRLAMILTNTTSIKDIILFPTLKKK